MENSIFRSKKNSRGLSNLLSLVLVFSSFVIMIGGTENYVKAANPNVIMDAAGLDAIRHNLTGNYILGADIDLGVAPYNVGEGWQPIGKSGDEFKGSFDGNGFAISGLTINRPTEENIGLFGYAEASTFVNIKLTDVNVTGKNSVGGLVGFLFGLNVFTKDSSVSGLVNGEDFVGGLVGKAVGDIERSSSEAVVSGNEYIGGLVGHIIGNIIDSQATGDVMGSNGVIGGLAGHISNGTVENSYASGDVTGTNYVGGLIGNVNPSTITNSYATGRVVGTGDYVGGLVGNLMSTTIITASIKDSYATGDVSGKDSVGGLLGNVNADVTESFAKGNITGIGSSVGGLAGTVTSRAMLTDTYATGTVTGESEVGALAGRLEQAGSVSNSYALAGTVPLIGVSVGNNVTVTDSFYDKGITNNNDPKRGIAKTSAELMQQATFTNWDFTSVWELPAGDYPRLQWEPNAGQPPVVGNIIYVKENGAGNEDGTSWANAFATLQEALEIATEGKLIWIAEGTYYPTKDRSGNDNPADARTKTFQMKNGVEIYGGFAGNEAADFDIRNRDFSANETILSGDLGAIGDKTDNAYHVFNNVNVTHLANLDGVTITGGNADLGADDSLTDSNNSGGGMYNLRSNLIITNVKVVENEAKHRGGGIFNDHSNIHFEKVFVANNRVNKYTFSAEIPVGGGGMNNYGDGEIVILFSVFENNKSASNGGGVRNGGGNSKTNSKLHLVDVMIKNNEGRFGGGLLNDQNDSRVIIDRGEIESNTVTGQTGGGGIYNSGEMMLNEVLITKNEAGRGAGIYVTGEANINITGTEIKENISARDGGGIHINGQQGANVDVKNTLLEGNIAQVDGGGVFNTNSAHDATLHLEDTIIKENKSTRFGGGLSSRGGKQTLNRVEIIDNESSDSGGGIYSEYRITNIAGVPTVFYSIIHLSNSEVIGNKSNDGGGIYSSRIGEQTITNVLISGNAATRNGGGMFHAYGSSPTLTNVTIAGNSATGDGGAMFNQSFPNDSTYPDTVAPMINNSIIWGNSSTIENIDAEPIISHSLLEGSGGSGAWDGSLGTDGGSNLDEDPLFVQSAAHTLAPSLLGDYRLQATSPAIERGSHAHIPVGVTTDLDGNIRIIGIVDMGAYEYGSMPPKEITTVETLTDITVAYGTNLAAVGLPAQVEVTLNDHSTVNLDVIWNNGAPVYDRNIAGTYTFTGQLTLGAGHINPNHISAGVQVTVRAKQVNPGNPGGIIWDGSSDTSLKRLEILDADGNDIQLIPSFTKDVFQYEIETVEKQVELVIAATHAGAQVMLKDEKVDDRKVLNLAIGKNEFVLTVKAENGSTKSYKLIIHRNEVAQGEHTPLYIYLTDIDGHWAETIIKRAVSDGIVSGHPDHQFKPDNPTTRAEFAVMLANALKLDIAETNDSFRDSDLIGDWAKRAVAGTVKERIVFGYEDNTFRPNQLITRSEMMSMIARALQLPQHAEKTGFADDTDIPAWAKGAVEASRMKGIVVGRGNNRFCPLEQAARAEAVAVIMRMMELK